MNVLVAMSGGVDSAVTALLLKKQGYTPIGITAKMWSGADSADIKDVESVCSKLGIDHYAIDLTDDFHKQIIRKFVDEYDCGHTPNPCIYCNEHIKFGVLFNFIKQYGCEKFATGHYARITTDADGVHLRRAKDVTKDQSYFLYTLKQDVLARLLLPLGDYTKEDIRALAQEAGIKVAHKSDSQDICFVPDGDYTKVLAKEGLKHSHAGNFELTDGRKIAKHKGTAYYTIGQRKGLGIAWEHPLYVVSKNAGTNAVILGKDEDLYQDKLQCSDLNFMEDMPDEFVCQAKIRYRAELADCKVVRNKDICQVTFLNKQRAITPGQAVVFYQQELVLGGGIITG